MTTRREFLAASAAAVAGEALPVVEPKPQPVHALGKTAQHILSGCHGPVRLDSGQVVRATHVFRDVPAIAAGKVVLLRRAGGAWVISAVEA